MADTGDRNPVGWFEIYVNDMSRARTFYEAVFDATLSRIGEPGQQEVLEMWAFPMQRAGSGAPGSLVRMPGFEAGRNSVIVYFSCADCAVEAAKAERAGGRILKPKFTIGEFGYIALVHDTEGNIIGLHSMQ